MTPMHRRKRRHITAIARAIRRRRLAQRLGQQVIQARQFRLVTGTKSTEQGLQTGQLTQVLLKGLRVAIVTRLDRVNGLQLAYQQAHRQGVEDVMVRRVTPETRALVAQCHTQGLFKRSGGIEGFDSAEQAVKQDDLALADPVADNQCLDAQGLGTLDAAIDDRDIGLRAITAEPGFARLQVGIVEHRLHGGQFVARQRRAR